MRRRDVLQLGLAATVAQLGPAFAQESVSKPPDPARDPIGAGRRA